MAASPAAPVFSTTQANDFIFASCGFTRTNGGAGNITTSWTEIDFINNGGGTNFAGVGAWYERVTSTQSGATASISSAASPFNIFSVDAITADIAGTNISLTAVAATGAIAAFAFNAKISLTGVAATGAVGSFGASSSLTLHAVAATGHAAPIFPLTSGELYVPLTTILNNKSIAVSGLVSVSPVAMTAFLPAQLPLAVTMNNAPIALSGQMMNAPVPMQGTFP